MNGIFSDGFRAVGNPINTKKDVSTYSVYNLQILEIKLERQIIEYQATTYLDIPVCISLSRCGTTLPLGSTIRIDIFSCKSCLKLIVNTASRPKIRVTNLE